MVDKKDKKYVYDNQSLTAEWNWQKNNQLGLDPKMLTLGCNKKVWWKCSKGHEWQAAINNRNKGSDCPYCSGKYAIKGENNLATINPQLAKEWNHEKNGDLKPENFTAGSGVKVWWKCQEGHEWLATIFNRNKANGTNCPQCYKNKSNKTK